MIMQRRELLIKGGFLAAATLLPLKARSQAGKSIRLISESPLEEPFVSQAHLALTKLAQEKGLDYKSAELVKAADYARVLRQWADEGVNLIVADAYGTEQVCRRTARSYPDTAFVLASSLGPVDPNVSTFYGQNYEACYLAGMLAGGMSDTGVIGVVAGLDVPATNVNINAYRSGAKEIRPDVKLKVAYIGSYFDPPKAKEAAVAQAEQGAKVIYADRVGAIEGAAEAKVMALGFMADQSAVAPDTVISSIIWDPYPLFAKAYAQVEAAAFKAEDLSPLELMSAGGCYLAPYGKFADTIPGALQEQIAARFEAIKTGAMKVEADDTTPTSD